MMTKKIFYGLCLLVLSGCVSTQVASVARQNPQEPELFITKLPVQPYSEISYLEAGGSIFHTRKKLLAKLKEKAKQGNADAIVNVQFGYVFWWPFVSGVTVQYIEAGPEKK